MNFTYWIFNFLIKPLNIRSISLLISDMDCKLLDDR